MQLSGIANPAHLIIIITTVIILLIIVSTPSNELRMTTEESKKRGKRMVSQPLPLFKAFAAGCLLYTELGFGPASKSLSGGTLPGEPRLFKRLHEPPKSNPPGSGRSADSMGMWGRAVAGTAGTAGMAAARARTVADVGLLPAAVGYPKGGRPLLRVPVDQRPVPEGTRPRPGSATQTGCPHLT